MFVFLLLLDEKFKNKTFGAQTPVIDKNDGKVLGIGIYLEFNSWLVFPLLLAPFATFTETTDTFSTRSSIQLFALVISDEI